MTHFLLEMNALMEDFHLHTRFDQPPCGAIWAMVDRLVFRLLSIDDDVEDGLAVLPCNCIVIWSAGRAVGNYSRLSM